MQQSDYIKALEHIIWNDHPVCPQCGYDKAYRTTRKARLGHRYDCANPECRKKYSILIGTPLSNTKLPLEKWFAIIANYYKGINESAMSRGLGITQRTANMIVNKIKDNPEILEWRNKHPQYFENLNIDLTLPIPEKIYLIHAKQGKRYKIENREKINEAKRRASEKLPDWMIRQSIKCNDPELIELKRAQILLTREIKKANG